MKSVTTHFIKLLVLRSWLTMLLNSHYLSVCQDTFWEKLDVDHYRDLIAAVFQRKAVVMPAPVHRILLSKNHYYVPLVS